MTKPKTITQKTAATAPDPLYVIVRDRIAAKDAETLDTRTEEALKRVEDALDGLGTVAAPAAEAFQGLGKLNPGEEAIGKSGWFWDKRGDGIVFAWGECDSYDPSDDTYTGSSLGWLAHFIEGPRTGAAFDAVLALIEKEAGK